MSWFTTDEPTAEPDRGPQLRNGLVLHETYRADEDGGGGHGATSLKQEVPRFYRVIQYAERTDLDVVDRVTGSPNRTRPWSCVRVSTSRPTRTPTSSDTGQVSD